MIRASPVLASTGRRLLQNVWPDVAFVGCNGWDITRGITSPTEEGRAEVGFNSQCKTPGAAGDSSKYGARSLFNVAHLNTLTDIVTDSRLDEAARTQLERLETRLTLAS